MAASADMIWGGMWVVSSFLETPPPTPRKPARCWRDPGGRGPLLAPWVHTSWRGQEGQHTEHPGRKQKFRQQTFPGTRQVRGPLRADDEGEDGYVLPLETHALHGEEDEQMAPRGAREVLYVRGTWPRPRTACRGRGSPAGGQDFTEVSER